MSYREVRNVVEMLRVLGYPRLVSMENFRTPNFKLVAEIMEWITMRFDSNSRIPSSIETEQDRVVFIKTVVLILYQKARLKLNPRKLYQADGHAVQEMLIPVQILYTALKQARRNAVDVEQKQIGATITSKLEELRKCRELAAQIPQTGATLYDQLAKELIARDERRKALSYSQSVSEAVSAIKQAIEGIREELKKINTNLANISSDETSLDSKIERKKRELEQVQKRLAKLQSFRPQYMDEYEKYEAKLKLIYSVYVSKFRNISYLQQVMADFDNAEQQKHNEAEEAMRHAVERMRAEEEALRLNDKGMSPEKEQNESRRKVTKVFGNMTGAGLSDEDDLETSELSDVDKIDSNDKLQTTKNMVESPAKSRLDRDDSDGMETSSGEDF
ncbi:hypothetical protein AB6A40_001843 [Gnathostoma spinigerum]|uniref:Clusterin-associated protein 1 n=1 Tax=Gnathostoma spinigerum TaxID=75299 RepID=A0ABD6E558_9BILA